MHLDAFIPAGQVCNINIDHFYLTYWDYVLESPLLSVVKS